MKYANINWLTLDLGGAGDTWRDINHRKPRGFHLRATGKAEEQKSRRSGVKRRSLMEVGAGHSRSCGRNGPRRSRYRACGERWQRPSGSRGRGRLGTSPGRRGDTQDRHADRQEERLRHHGEEAVSTVHLSRGSFTIKAKGSIWRDEAFREPRRGDGTQCASRQFTRTLTWVRVTVSAPARWKRILKTTQLRIKKNQKKIQIAHSWM